MDKSALRFQYLSDIHFWINNKNNNNNTHEQREHSKGNGNFTRIHWRMALMYLRMLLLLLPFRFLWELSGGQFTNATYVCASSKIRQLLTSSNWTCFPFEWAHKVGEKSFTSSPMSPDTLSGKYLSSMTWLCFIVHPVDRGTEQEQQQQASLKEKEQKKRWDPQWADLIAAKRCQ